MSIFLAIKLFPETDIISLLLKITYKIDLKVNKILKIGLQYFYESCSCALLLRIYLRRVQQSEMLLPLLCHLKNVSTPTTDGWIFPRNIEYFKVAFYFVFLKSLLARKKTVSICKQMLFIP